MQFKKIRTHLSFIALAAGLSVGSIGTSAHAADSAALEKGMKCAVEKYGLAGSNVFTGEPLTATKGPSFASKPEFSGYNEGSRDPKLASFPPGVGLIGRAWSSETGTDFSKNVQELPGDKFLRLELAKKFGVRGTLGVRFDQYSAVIEFYSDEAKSEWDVAGIKACFE